MTSSNGHVKKKKKLILGYLFLFYFFENRLFIFIGEEFLFLKEKKEDMTRVSNNFPFKTKKTYFF